MARVNLDHDPRHALNLPVRADRLDEAAARRGFVGIAKGRLLDLVLRELPESAYGDDDLPALAVGAGAAVAESLRGLGVARRRRGLAAREGEEAALGWLDGHARDRMAGGPSGEDLTRSFAGIGAAIRIAAIEDRVDVRGAEVLRHLHAYIEGFVVPRLTAAWADLPGRGDDMRDLTMLAR